MSATIEYVVELCDILASYAQRLEELRSSPFSGDLEIPGYRTGGSLWGGTVGATRNASAEAPRWYHALDPIYEKLDRVIRGASAALCDDVLSDQRVLAAESSLHLLRAAYEYDKEIDQAQAILASADNAAQLARLIEQESYWALGPELRQALLGSANILVAGSGPLPLSALSIAAAVDAQITCLEHDPEGFELGRRLIEVSDHSHSVTCIDADIVDLDRLDAYDAILGVVLLGVHVRGRSASRKSDIAKHVLTRVRPGAKFVFREPHGLGRLLYPSMALNADPGIEVIRWVPTVGPMHPYRSALVVASQANNEPLHAQPGTVQLH